MRPLTDKQREVFEFVDRYAHERGFPPTLREIGQAIGLAHVTAVRGHLAALEKKGYIAREPDKARSIQILRPFLLSRFKRRLHRFAGTDDGVLHRVVYGVVLATRGRAPLFDSPERRGRLKAALGRLGAEHGRKFLEQRIEPDCVALVVEVWPNHSPELVARRVRAACRPRDRGSAWAPGYAATTAAEQLDDLAAQFLDSIRQADRRRT